MPVWSRARKARLLRFAMNLYPPFLGAGIRVRHIAGDFREVRVRMGLNRLNRNYVGTQFGGSLYAMTDPFFMLMLMENLGRDYVVWDKAANIEFGFGLGFSVLRDPAIAQSPESPGTWRWGGAYGHSWFVDRARELSVVALTNTLFEGMSGRFVNDLRDAVYRSAEVR